jgi:tripartite-type tricarboxylate transporter receptor subunit TctC
VVLQINAEIKKTFEDKATLEKFAALGAEPYDTKPDEFAAILHADIKK